MTGACGVYTHNMDAKGRIAIPSDIRAELGDIYYVTISMEKCLTGYSEESWQEFLKKIKAMPRAKQLKIRPIFAHAAKCVVDAQGRILIPQRLRDFAALGKRVAVVGDGECVEFWDEAAWSAIDDKETTPENIAEVLTELDF